MIKIKILNNNEKIKIDAVKCLTLGKDIMLPHIIFGNLCIVPMAKSVDQKNHPDPNKIAILFSKWYMRTTDNYSDGIYSFARKGQTKKGFDEPFYRYIKREIDCITFKTNIRPEYREIEILARKMWELGYEQYKDTFFWSYNLLHGDLHPGNIVFYKDNYHIINWENFRSGPKEIELAFYLCCDYMRWGDTYRSLEEITTEVDIFLEKRLISHKEKERILYFLIPMWMLLMVLYLNNGNLLFEKERKVACQRIIPLYNQTIFSRRPWKELSENE